MRIVIIGSGNVASVLGRLLKKNDHEILQVISRNAMHAKSLADELHCAYADHGGTVDPGADIYLVAVQDTALHELNTNFNMGNKLVLHTAGSVSKDILSTLSSNYGILYPLQSLRKEMHYEDDIPFLIDGNTAETITMVEDLANSLSRQVAQANDDQRLKLHVAAVIVSNFTNHLYALAEAFCEKEQVDFKLLVPLIKETAARVEKVSPANAQTGPAARKDAFTLEKHLRILSLHPELKYIYLKLTDSIVKSRTT